MHRGLFTPQIYNKCTTLIMINFPLFVYAQDDHSMGLMFNEEELCYYIERPDIDEGLYLVWDSLGRRLTLQWDEITRRAKVLDSPGYPDKENLLDAYKNYYQSYKNQKRTFWGKEINALLCKFEVAERILEGIGLKIESEEAQEKSAGEKGT